MAGGKFFPILAAALIGAGCVSINENRLADGSLSVEIGDSGWYLFGYFPLASGNPDGWWPHWFSDDVTPEQTMAILDRILVREKATAIGPVVTHRADEKVFVIVTRSSYHTSAVIPAVKQRLEEQNQ